MLKKIFEDLMELIYPSNIYCIACGNLIDKTRPYSLCDSCVRTLKWNNKSSCEKCGKKLNESFSQNLCSDCMESQHFFEKGYSCVEYGLAERKILHNFKYKDKAYLCRKLSEIMYDRINLENLNVDMLIPVPMYIRKQRIRGYNQAELLTKYLSIYMQLPYYKKVLVRKHDTKPMNSLGVEERKENIKKAFTVKDKWVKIIQNKKILLIDDIYTTGSTVDECSRMLLNNGADKIYVFAFAAGADILKKV
ncbi:ComF family protein [Anaerovorax odorimutans]|uniref:ComF family protein n=1 Tax=Anaerovorax odorimutans TaxID=109327 RepID=UPI0003FB5150|nr:ComF family protein [Anaerovorax odorimutans]